MTRYKNYRAIGFLFSDNQSSEIAEYFDFTHLKWAKEDLDWDLRNLNLPTGLLIRFPDGNVKIVLGNTLKEMDKGVRPIAPDLNLFK